MYTKHFNKKLSPKKRKEKCSLNRQSHRQKQTQRENISWNHQIDYLKIMEVNIFKGFNGKSRKEAITCDNRGGNSKSKERKARN